MTLNDVHSRLFFPYVWWLPTFFKKTLCSAEETHTGLKQIEGE